MTRTRPQTLFTLTLILCLAAALRMMNIGELSLWIDEGFTYYATQQGDLLAVLERDVHPPLYFALISAWVSVAGVSEVAFRYLSLLAGMVSVALIYQLAREVTLFRPRPVNRAVPVIAALLMALSEMEAYTAQEARSYTLHVALAILSMWAYLRWSRLYGRSGATSWGITWVVSTTLLVYTHYLGAWAGVVQGLHVLLFLRGRQRIVAVSLLIASALLFGVWLVTVVIPYQFGKAGNDATIDPSTLATLISYVPSYFTGQWALWLSLAGLGLVAVDREQLKARPISASALLILWIVVPLALTFIGNLRFSILTNYRVSQISVPIVLLVAFGLGYFRPRTRAFLLAVIMLYGVVSVDVYRPKFPWRDFGALASQYIQPDHLVVMDLKGVDFSIEYYLHRNLKGFERPVQIESLRRWVEWEQDRFPVEFPQLLGEAGAVWVVRWNDSDLIHRLLTDSGHIRTARRTFPYGTDTLEVIRYDRPPLGAPVAEYENGMVLHAVAVFTEHLQVDLLWSRGGLPAEERLANYTTSAFLLDSGGRLVAQRDSPPLDGERPTRRWDPDSLVYEAKRMIPVEGLPLPPGVYRVGVQVYRQTPEGTERARTLDGEPWAIVGEIVIETPGG